MKNTLPIIASILDDNFRGGVISNVEYCWRTGHDVRDTWESISAMVDKEADLYSYAKPGSWNDPDILVIELI